MTGEQSVLVFGVLCVVIFITLLNLSGKKKSDKKVNAGPNSVPHHHKTTNRSQRHKR